jgi:hypothetical protein
MADRLAGQIGASSRYALVPPMTAGTDVEVYVSCLDANDQYGAHLGVVCMTEFNYQPWLNQGVALSVGIDGRMSEGSESDVAQHLFDNFAQQTSDDNLAKAAAENLPLVNLAIKEHPEGLK